MVREVETGRRWARLGNRLAPALVATLVGLMLVSLPLPLAATIVGGSVVVVLVLVQPFVGVALMLLAGPWGALENVVLGNALFDSGQLLFLLTVAAWLGRAVVQRRIILHRTRLMIPLALFIGVSAFSLLDAPSVSLGIKELLKWLEIAVLMLLVMDLAKSEGGAAGASVKSGHRLSSARVRAARVRALVAILLLAGLSQALIGIWQFGLRGSGPEHFLILDRFYRAYGTFEQPNPYGGFMSWNAALGLGTLLGIVTAWWQGREVSGKLLFASLRKKTRVVRFSSLFSRPAAMGWPAFVGVCTVASGTALLLSWSRGAWLSLVAAAAVLLFFWPPRRWRGLLLLSAAAALLLVSWQLDVIPAPLAMRMSSFTQDLRFGDVRGANINDANYAVLERLAHWQAALEMARHNLWLGVGFGNYELAYPEYALLNWPFPLGHAHNYYLNLLAEVGIAGTLAYLLFWFFVFRQSVLLLRRLHWPQRGIVLGLLAAWTALTVHHLLDKLYVNNLYLYLGVMLGVLQALDDEGDQKSTG